jgi:hypothetical protein
MKELFFLLFLCLLISSTACQQKRQAKKDDLASYFSTVQPDDTMRFEVVTQEEGGLPGVPGDTIPTSFFFSQLETHLMNDVWYFDNSGELTVSGKYRFPLSENREAYLVGISQHWYRHLSLFLFDQQKKAFTGRVTVAEFYGGDGGQILSGSWLIDYDGDGDKDLVRRETEHWMDVSGEEPQEQMKESASLLLWENGQFVASPAQDTAALIRRFPIHSLW